jgi:hypothetical protein
MHSGALRLPTPPSDHALRSHCNLHARTDNRCPPNGWLEPSSSRTGRISAPTGQVDLFWPPAAPVGWQGNALRCGDARTVPLGLLVTPSVTDHWEGTHRQAIAKDTPGWSSRLACPPAVGTPQDGCDRHGRGLGRDAGPGPEPVVGGSGSGRVGNVALRGGRCSPLLWLVRAVRRVDVSDLTVSAGMGVPRLGHDGNPRLGAGAYAPDQS